MEKQTELVKQDSNNPAELLRLAVTNNVDIEKMEKLMALKERYDANEARKAYVEAMTAFKSKPLTIFKDKSVSFGAGKASYKHASLAHILATISNDLSKHGLSVSWSTKQNGQVDVTCKITHHLGHSEETTLSAPSDTSGSKNAIQAIGSTISYLQRYTVLNLLGLATADQDDDGKASEPIKTISEKQAITIRDYIVSTNANEAKFLKYMGVESVEEIPVKQYQKAINVFKAQEKK